MIDHKNEMEILSFVLNALTTDGDHHKQWYLEGIAEILGVDVNSDEAQARWEHGIAP